MDATPITYSAIRRAANEVYRHLQPSPLVEHPLLSQAVGARVLVKHENTLPTCAFKIRGGMHLLSCLSHQERRRGLVTATRGNHGQSIALASATYGAKCTIFVPVGNNPEKNAAMRAFGATVVETGRDFDEARAEAQKLVEEEGALFVPVTEPRLVMGVGTLALEIFEQVKPDYVFVSVGLGTLSSGVAIVRRELSPQTKVIAVQAANAPAVHDAWRSGEIRLAASANTMADGLASRIASANTLEILRRELDDFQLVTEAELHHGVRLAVETTHHVAEGASAASFAAVYRMRAQLAGKTVVLVHSGANLATELLAKILSERP